MEKKSELMKVLKELTEKRLLSNEVEALFEPYKDVVFPLSLSFVSSERSFGSQKDATYNEGYKVICNVENWNVEVTILFAPEDNTLVESYDSGQDFEVNVRFIDYDSLYQRAIFGKLSSELTAPEEEELTAPEEEEVAVPEEEEVAVPEEEEVAVPLIAESDRSTIETTASTPTEESIVPEKEISAPESESESEAPEIVTEEPQRSAGTTGEVWGWDPKGDGLGDDIDQAKVIHIKPPIILKDLADKMGIKPFNIIKDLMALDVFASLDSSIEPDVATTICDNHGFVFEKEKREKGGNEKGHKIADTQEVMDLGSAQSDPVPPPVQSSQESRYVYTQSESQLWEDDYGTDEVEQNSSQSTGCSKGCMEKVSTTCYVVGVLLMLGSCRIRGGEDLTVFGLILIVIGYAAQKATSKG
ncbi:MAG: translation initiation factor IF-2 N-terminal domain-containing protein [Verrucomicrobiales bacterium]|nr:translation initiation factor IF-2 N-terminal domain-containing protein [Verrucomicrobiales bacterium]